MKDLSMAVVAAGLGIFLAISFGVFLFVVLSLQTAAVIATAGAFLLMFALGVYAGVRSVAANGELSKHGLADRAG